MSLHKSINKKLLSLPENTLDSIYSDICCIFVCSCLSLYVLHKVIHCFSHLYDMHFCQKCTFIVKRSAPVIEEQQSD